MHFFGILCSCLGKLCLAQEHFQNYGHWEIILVQLGLLYPLNWCKYILYLLFSTKYAVEFWVFLMFKYVY